MWNHLGLITNSSRVQVTMTRMHIFGGLLVVYWAKKKTELNLISRVITGYWNVACVWLVLGHCFLLVVFLLSFSPRSSLWETAHLKMMQNMMTHLSAFLYLSLPQHIVLKILWQPLGERKTEAKRDFLKYLSPQTLSPLCLNFKTDFQIIQRRNY